MTVTGVEGHIEADAETDRPSFMATVRETMSMSWPIMLGALSMAVLNIGQVSLLGNAIDQRPLYLLSMMQPYYLLFFAFLEAVAISAQVFSARSRKTWPRRNVGGASVAFALLGCLIVFGLTLVVDLVPLILTVDWPILSAEVSAVVPSYLISLMPLLVFEVLNGALRGQGRTLPGFLVLSVAVGLNLGLSYVLVFQKAMGLDGILAANVISGVATLPVIGLVLAYTLRGAERGPRVQALMRMGILLGTVGAPIFLSLVVSFFSSAVLIDLVARFGEHYASGLLIVVRARFFFLIPAVALATSIAVLVNQEAGNSSAAHRRARLGDGMVVVILMYVVMTVALFALRVPLVRLIAGDEEVYGAALMILNILLPSFFLVGVAVAFQVILENLGRGARVLVWTVLLEGATCAALIHWGVDVRTALIVLLGAAVIYTLAFGVEFARFVGDRRPPGADLAPEPAEA